MRYCGMCYGTAAHRLWFHLESRREADRLGSIDVAADVEMETELVEADSCRIAVTQ